MNSIDTVGRNALKFIYNESVYAIPNTDAVAIVPSQPKREVTIAKDPKKKIIGGILKKILVVNGESQPEIIQSGNLTFLAKVLSSVQLGLEDVGIITWDQTLDLEKLKQEY